MSNNKEEIQTLQTKDFSLEHTIESGQFFLYEQIDDWYYITHTNNIFKVKQENDILYYKGISKIKLIDFLALDLDLREETKNFKDEIVLEALEKYWGLKHLRQDLWQTIIGFICSSAANIPKIQNNLRLMSKYFGEKVEFEGKTFYTFPKPGSLNNLDLLKECKTGYRAKYLFEFNEYVIKYPNYLKELEQLSYKQAKEELVKRTGIGVKVADCICLFGLQKSDAFPIDTWVKQIIEKFYLKREAKNLKEIEKFIEEYFVDNKGLQQQYLFHYIRNLKE